MFNLVAIADITGALIGISAALAASSAGAHDWYEDVTNAHGERCCGGKERAADRRLDTDDVEEVRGGFLIRSIGIVVPYAATQPSPDRRYHACVWWTPKQEVKCFFVPTPGS